MIRTLTIYKALFGAPIMFGLAACGGATSPVSPPPTVTPDPPSVYSTPNQLSLADTLIANATSYAQIAASDTTITVETANTAASNDMFDIYFNSTALTTDGQLLAVPTPTENLPQNATYSGHGTAFAEIVHDDIRYELNAGNTAIHLTDGEIVSIVLDEFASTSTLSSNPNFFDPDANGFSISLNDFGALTSCGTGTVCSPNATLILNNPGTINNDSLNTEFTGIFAGPEAQEFGGLIVTDTDTSVVRGAFIAER